MSLEYELQENGKIVIAHATGVLTLQDFISMAENMKRDDDLRDPHNTLLDVRSVSEVRLTDEDLQTIADGLTSGSRKLGARKLAIVATKEQSFNLGNKYQHVTKGVSETVIVFYSAETARTWLGLKG